MNAPKFFAPTNDFVFKKIFGDERNIDILADFLQAVLDLPPDEYEHIKLVDPCASLRSSFAPQPVGRYANDVISVAPHPCGAANS
jgi:hypothetical protein